MAIHFKCKQDDDMHLTLDKVIFFYENTCYVSPLVSLVHNVLAPYVERLSEAVLMGNSFCGQ